MLNTVFCYIKYEYCKISLINVDLNFNWSKIAKSDQVFIVKALGVVMSANSVYFLSPTKEQQDTMKLHDTDRYILFFLNSGFGLFLISYIYVLSITYMYGNLVCVELLNFRILRNLYFDFFSTYKTEAANREETAA